MYLHYYIYYFIQTSKHVIFFCRGVSNHPGPVCVLLVSLRCTALRSITQANPPRVPGMWSPTFPPALRPNTRRPVCFPRAFLNDLQKGGGCSIPGPKNSGFISWMEGPLLHPSRHSNAIVIDGGKDKKKGCGHWAGSIFFRKSRIYNPCFWKSQKSTHHTLYGKNANHEIILPANELFDSQVRITLRR